MSPLQFSISSFSFSSALCSASSRFVLLGMPSGYSRRNSHSKAAVIMTKRAALIWRATLYESGIWRKYSLSSAISPRILPSKPAISFCRIYRSALIEACFLCIFQRAHSPSYGEDHQTCIRLVQFLSVHSPRVYFRPLQEEESDAVHHHEKQTGILHFDNLRSRCRH